MILLATLVLSGGCLQDGGPADQTSDGDGAGNTAIENTPPVADAGADQTASVGDLVVLDATGSSDADNDQLIYIWRQIAGEPEVLLDNVSASRPRFFVPGGITEETVLTFRLIVVDGFTADSDDVAVTIQPEADGG
jgi:hypothetical protein